MRITSVRGQFVYGTMPLGGGKTKRVHCALFLKYRGSLLGKQIPQDMLELAERTEFLYEVIEKIFDLCQDHGGLL